MMLYDCYTYVTLYFIIYLSYIFQPEQPLMTHKNISGNAGIIRKYGHTDRINFLSYKRLNSATAWAKLGVLHQSGRPVYIHRSVSSNKYLLGDSIQHNYYVTHGLRRLSVRMHVIPPFQKVYFCIIDSLPSGITRIALYIWLLDRKDTWDEMHFSIQAPLYIL